MVSLVIWKILIFSQIEQWFGIYTKKRSLDMSFDKIIAELCLKISREMENKKNVKHHHYMTIFKIFGAIAKKKSLLIELPASKFDLTKI